MCYILCGQGVIWCATASLWIRLLMMKTNNRNRSEGGFLHTFHSLTTWSDIAGLSPEHVTVAVAI